MRIIVPLFISLVLAGSAAAGGVRQIRISAQFVAMPHPVLTELLAAPDKRGHILHRMAMERVAKGEANILEQCMIVCKSGQRATVETINEFIYATEYEPPELPCSPPSPRTASNGIRDATPSAWDTRNVGVTFEVEPGMNADETMVDLRFIADFVTLARMNTICSYRVAQGDQSIRMPVFEALRTNTALFLAPGRFDLAAVLAPKTTAPGPALNKKVMLFIRAEILTVSPGR